MINCLPSDGSAVFRNAPTEIDQIPKLSLISLMLILHAQKKETIRQGRKNL